MTGGRSERLLGALLGANGAVPKEGELCSVGLVCGLGKF